MSFRALATPVQLTLGTVYTWNDQDVSAYLPAGATGAIIHWVSPTATNNALALRKKGSTDDRTGSAFSNANGHPMTIVGVDSDRVFQEYHYDSPPAFTLEAWLIGYTMPGVVFFTNAYDKTPAAGAWTDIDLSVECPGAIGIIAEVNVGSFGYGIRKNGSSDNRNERGNHKWVIIGCDANQIIEFYDGSSAPSLWILGYITAGATFKTNADDKSLTAADAWTAIDCSAESEAAAIMLFFEVVTGGNLLRYGLRKRGSTEDIYGDLTYTRHPFEIVPCNTAQVVDGKIETTVVDFFLVGYATVVAPTVVTEEASSISGTRVVLNGTLSDNGGEDCDCYFEYGETTDYGKTTATQTKGTGDSFEQEVVALKGGTVYHYRTVATNQTATTYGADKTVQTHALTQEAQQAFSHSNALSRSDL